MTLRSILAALRPVPPLPRARAADRRAGFRPRLESLDDRCLPSSNVVLHWNEILLQSLSNQPPRVPLSRNMALVHVAMFDAVNAIDRSYEPYHARVIGSRAASPEAAAAQAAHDTLVALYPTRQAIYDAALAEDLAGIPADRAGRGIAVGQEVARQILDLRSTDGASAIMSYTPPSNDPGQWHPTPPDFAPAGAVHVSQVTPFATESSSQFRPGPPPGLDTPEYAAAFNEAKALGSVNSTARTADQTQVAMLWRQALTNHVVWNRIAQDVADDRDATLVEDARLFALMNMTLHDGLQTSFGAKYHYALWRPVEAIRRAAEDGNPATEADPAWTTLHPTTPPYPTYSGNAATIGATCATVLAGVLGSDAIPFEVRWDAYGFPGVVRSYDGFWEAADELARSRIYGGIHFTFDSVAGQYIGRNVGGYVLDNFLRPVERVAAAGVFNGELVVNGTDGGDVLNIVRAGTDLVVWANGQELGRFAVPLSGIVLDGGDGNDLILISHQVDTAAEVYGGAGNDLISGGSGDDRISGEDGHDVLLGNSGNDRLDGGAGMDFLFGGFGNDFLYGGLDDDWLFGGPGVDSLDGGPGHNRLFP
jgi:hypothetical protein